MRLAGRSLGMRVAGGEKHGNEASWGGGAWE